MHHEGRATCMHAWELGSVLDGNVNERGEEVAYNDNNSIVHCIVSLGEVWKLWKMELAKAHEGERRSLFGRRWSWALSRKF